jgi:DNA-directed RNA polymerase subunit RPC12/RpoP
MSKKMKNTEGYDIGLIAPEICYICESCGSPVVEEEVLSLSKRYKEKKYRVTECKYCPTED